MKDSKIESSQLNTHFKTAAEQTNNNNAASPLSIKIKRQLLDFYNLLSDMMCRTPYFDKLPKELVEEIISHLQKDGAKEEKAISAFVATHKRMYTLFQPTRLGDLTTQLLWNTVTGQQDKAEKIVDMHPELQLKRGTITDYSGRTFKNITAYEYAYWAKDTHMCRMLERHMDRETKLAMLKCCEAIEKNGLTYEQDGVEVKGSKHFDMTPLLNALKNFRDYLRNGFDFNTLTTNEHQVIRAQCDVPVHVANEYCRVDRSFYPTPTFKDGTLPRVFDITTSRRNTSKYWYPLTDEYPNRFILLRVNENSCFAPKWIYPSRVADGIDLDLEALEHLDKVRTEELAELRENLRRVEPKLDNELSCF
ncbi:SidC homolog [Legionella steigerwaltii]|uniref:SidC homolog n=1 Tax=Legionella steigerwaltii TaxID=460 RepID=A0A378LCZ3_9GAMM|nr:hypothetical protein [Legionella steigerwaltii]KTD77255.1 hypothetical protein Lstg_1612 [Legionella steigerwaltii]STY21981.1 SidC homolog [Legionella steigerwaltii]